MTGIPPPLPEGVRAETFTYANSRTETIYKRAMAEEGPILRIEGGVRYLADHCGHRVRHDRFAPRRAPRRHYQR